MENHQLVKMISLKPPTSKDGEKKHGTCLLPKATPSLEEKVASFTGYHRGNEVRKTLGSCCEWFCWLLDFVFLFWSCCFFFLLLLLVVVVVVAAVVVVVVMVIKAKVMVNVVSKVVTVCCCSLSLSSRCSSSNYVAELKSCCFFFQITLQSKYMAQPPQKWIITWLAPLPCNTGKRRFIGIPY